VFLRERASKRAGAESKSTAEVQRSSAVPRRQNNQNLSSVERPAAAQSPQNTLEVTKRSRPLNSLFFFCSSDPRFFSTEKPAEVPIVRSLLLRRSLLIIRSLLISRREDNTFSFLRHLSFLFSSFFLFQFSLFVFTFFFPISRCSLDSFPSPFWAFFVLSPRCLLLFLLSQSLPA